MEYRYPTAFNSWGIEEHEAIDRVLNSKRYTQGSEVEAFEREIAAYHGRAHAIMVNSGSSANLIAVAAMRQLDEFKDGDTVLVPAIAWSTTYAPLVQHGLNLQLVDVDETWNASPNSFRTDPGNIRLVVGCSILGNPAYLKDWANIAGVLGCPLLEDNCESLGAETIDDVKTGTFGLCSTLSLFWSHQIGAIEGGVILTDDHDVDAMCRILRAHGWTRDIDPIEDAPTGFSSEYYFVAMGYNVRGLELHAAIAREQLKKLPNMIRRRQENYDHFFRRVLMNPEARIGVPTPNGRMSPFGIQFEVPEDKRQAVADALRAKGIDCRLPTGGSFRLHPYGNLWAKQRTPIADRIHQRGMFIGNGPLDLRSQIDEAFDIILRVTS